MHVSLCPSCGTYPLLIHRSVRQPSSSVFAGHLQKHPRPAPQPLCLLLSPLSTSRHLCLPPLTQVSPGFSAPRRRQRGREGDLHYPHAPPFSRLAVLHASTTSPLLSSFSPSRPSCFSVVVDLQVDSLGVPTHF
jgi:hypothetical protein